MTTLILPIAGNSSRFNRLPKWLQSHPKGGIMLNNSMKGIYRLDRVIVVPLFEQVNIFQGSLAAITSNIQAEGFIPDVYLLEHSDNQVHTVMQALVAAEKAGRPVTDNFIVKDCDNFFILDDELTGNFVAYARLHDYHEVTAANKSYIQLDSMGVITNIVEKKVISDTFCVGGYGFESVSTFKRSYYNLPNIPVNEEIHLSHLIYNSMLTGDVYKGLQCRKYIDWGTQEEWNKYLKKEEV